MRTFKVISAVLVAVSVLATTAHAGSGVLRFRVFARTGIRLTDIVWTGQRFLYIANTTNRIVAAGPAGKPYTPFARMPRQIEETRCVTSPGNHGFPRGYLYCHSPDNKIYRISPNGKTVRIFAVLPHSPRSDGAITFDTEGAFGYALLAATGRSGATTPRGGTVFSITQRGRVHRIGSYANAGGADEIAIAPAAFGSASRQVLLTVDAGHSGDLVAMNARGHARTLLYLPDGPNPIVALTRNRVPLTGAAHPGLYVTDTLSHLVYFTPSPALQPFTGAVVIGSELHGYFWIVRPRGHGFAAQRLTTNLTRPSYNLEGAIYIAPRSI